MTTATVARSVEPTVEPLRSRLDAALQSLGVACEWSSFLGKLRVNIPVSELTAVMTKLKQAGFDMLIDVTAVDLLEYADATDRYRVVYQLLDLTSGSRLELTTHVNDPTPEVASMVPLWMSANWMEREVYDMYGIVFLGHPNPKRLLLPQEFVSFPLRKDYPVKGRGERHNFPVITRAES